MTESEILAIYKAQSRNVRYLKQVIQSFKRDINSDIRKNKSFQVETKTKLLALLYSAWSEAQFVQIAYTEKGFSGSEIKSLLNAKKNGITKGWIEMISLAFAKVGDPNTDIELGNRLSKLLGLVASQITKPSSIRNKIAHGQWVEALNGSLNKVDSAMTGDLDSLDSVQIMRQIEIHNYLGKVIRDLVQSPTLGFGRDYLHHITALEKYSMETQGWSVATKLSELDKKPVRYKP